MRNLLAFTLLFLMSLTGARAQGVTTVTPDQSIWQTYYLQPQNQWQEAMGIAMAGTGGNAGGNLFGAYSYGYFTNVPLSSNGQWYPNVPDGVTMSTLPGGGDWLTEGTSILGEAKIVRLYLEYICHCAGYIIGLLLVMLTKHGWDFHA